MKSGILLVRKPKGLTSHDVVDRARKSIGQREVGHAGTLDPMAEGLLVVLLGEATKLSEYVLTGDKSYRVRVEFGKSTTTWDAEGEIVDDVKIQLDPIQIRTAAEKLIGEFNWPVPIFSAIKKDGKKLYQYAREEKKVEIPSKKMCFWGVDIIEVSSNSLECELSCSKGSYIRSWCVQLGGALGTPSMMSGLIRTKSAPYCLSEAISIDEIASSEPQSLDSALPGWKTVTVKGREQVLMGHGQIPHDLAKRLIPEQREAITKGGPVGIKVIDAESGALVALLIAEPGRSLKIRRIFNTH